MGNVKKVIFGIAIIAMFSSCTNGDEFSGLILTDKATGKIYKLKYNFGDNYFIDEQFIEISGKDTTIVWK